MLERPRDGSVPALVYRRLGTSEALGRDDLVAEEPLEIRIHDATAAEEVRFVVTMRTPGHDWDLAIGLLYGEGVIESVEEVLDVSRPKDPRVSPELARNVAVVTLAPHSRGPRQLPVRNTVMGSACGVCGRTSVEDVVRLAEASRRRPAGSGPNGHEDFVLPASRLLALPEALAAHQSLFATTGGLHAAGLFDAAGTLLLAREDVGRHNATDKAVGAHLQSGRPAPPILLVSGRLGFEIVQKAALIDVRVVAAVSAPTNLAVELAEEVGITVVGFLRRERFNVYTHRSRIDTTS